MEFNAQRSHEALGRKTPAQVYQSASRRYPERIPDVVYDNGYRVRQVRQNGEIKWQGQLLYLSQVLAKEPIGSKQIEESLWEIYFSFYLLGMYDERQKRITSCRL